MSKRSADKHTKRTTADCQNAPKAVAVSHYLRRKHISARFLRFSFLVSLRRIESPPTRHPPPTPPSLSSRSMSANERGRVPPPYIPAFFPSTSLSYLSPISPDSSRWHRIPSPRTWRRPAAAPGRGRRTARSGAGPRGGGRSCSFGTPCTIGSTRFRDEEGGWDGCVRVGRRGAIIHKRAGKDGERTWQQQ